MEYFKNGGLSFPLFIATCRNVADFAQRDLAELGTCGVTQEKIDALQLHVDNLLDNKSNLILLAQKKVKNKNKENFHYFFSDKLSIIKKQLSNFFNKEDGMYDNMFSKTHSQMRVTVFLNHVNDIFQALKDNKEALVEYHFVESDITAFGNDIATLTQLEKEKEQADISFNNDTYQRSEARRATYELLYFISSMGKVYWKRKDPAKSQDYNISRKPKRKTKVVETENTETNEIINQENTSILDTENNLSEADTTINPENSTESPTDTNDQTLGNPAS